MISLSLQCFWTSNQWQSGKTGDLPSRRLTKRSTNLIQNWGNYLLSSVCLISYSFLIPRKANQIDASFLDQLQLCLLFFTISKILALCLPGKWGWGKIRGDLNLRDPCKSGNCINYSTKICLVTADLRLGRSAVFHNWMTFLIFTILLLFSSLRIWSKIMIS